MFDTQLDLLDELDNMRWESYVSTFCKSQNADSNQNFIDLARYASFPIILSSDLLYKIYLNFIASKTNSEKTLQIWEASEFLFSPIIKELGYDLYEILPGLRQSLKNKLKYPEKIRMAFFMKEYAEKCKNNFQSDQIEKAQILNYQIELDPSKAIMEVLKIISESKGQPIGNHASYLLEYGKSLIGTGTNSELKSRIESAEALLKGINKQDSTDIENALKGFDIGASTDGIKISIPSDVKIDIESEKPTKRKLRALVVGAGNHNIDIQDANINSAILFKDKLNLLTSDKIDCTLITGKKASKANILNEIESIIKNAKQKDDLLFCISSIATVENGKSKIACFDSPTYDSVKIEENLFLSDFEIGELFKTVECASITFILQYDNAASPYWLENCNNFKSKTIVFASCKFDQSSPITNIENKYFCSFTYFLIEAMSMDKNNRNIFADAINKMSIYSTNLKSEKSLDLENTTPVLIGNPEAYNLNFIKGSDEDYLLKNQLFKANYTNKTAYELDSEEFGVLKNDHLKDHTQVLELTNKLKEINILNSELPPIFLLIYSDYSQKLEHLKKEKNEILILLTPLNVVVLLLENPDSVAFSNLMKSPKYRNRIQMIYYAGYDDNEGNMYLNEKSFNIDEFAELLNYQENIKLFFSNTCRSKLYAEYLTQMGVKYSYGFEGEVSDQIAAEKGVEFFKNLVNNGSIQNLELNIR